MKNRALTIIVDAGGSKSDWCVIPVGDSEPYFFATEGINTALSSPESIRYTVASARQFIDEALKTTTSAHGHEKETADFRFYGAGLSSPMVADGLLQILSEYFEVADSSLFASDLTGAACACLQGSPGIACILGTGSASGLYDGSVIKETIPSLGFIAGDEGSGAFMGKQLLNMFFKRELPSHLSSSLTDFSNMDYAEVVSKIYRQQAPNKYLASFVPFIKKNEHNEIISKLIHDSLKLFLTKNVLKYKTGKSLPLGFCGGVAYSFQSQIMDICRQLDFKVANIIKRPIEHLADHYYK